MAEDAEKEEAAVAGDAQPLALSKSARKKQQKQERLAVWKAVEKERRRDDVERRRREWDEALAAAPSEEARIEMVATRRKARCERVGQLAEERGTRAERLRRAAEGAGQKVVLDLEFGDLTRPNEIHSLPTLPCPSTPDPAATYAPDVALPCRSPAATDSPMRPIPALLWPHQTPCRHTMLHGAGSLPPRPLGPPLPSGSFSHKPPLPPGSRLTYLLPITSSREATPPYYCSSASPLGVIEPPGISPSPSGPSMATPQVKQTILKLFGFKDDVVTHLFAGLDDGFFVVCVSSPVDVVKSRMMGDLAYTSTLDCFMKTLKNDGPLAFYKGFLPNFARLGSSNVIMFLTLEQVQKLFVRKLGS